LKYSAIKKRYSNFRAAEYEKLKQDLEEYQLTQEEIADFFSQKGIPIFDWALITSSECQALFFFVRLSQ